MKAYCHYKKAILLLLILTISLDAASQNSWEISLSKKSKSEQMGIWEEGDYLIYVELDLMKMFLSKNFEDYTKNILRCSEKDSNLVNYYRPTAKRYQDALSLVEAANKEFDLRSLIVYHGLEDKRQNVGNSQVIRAYIKQLVENGTAIVIYKGEQIFTLKCKTEFKLEGGILNSGYEVRIYFDDIENCIFLDFRHTGW